MYAETRKLFGVPDEIPDVTRGSGGTVVEVNLAATPLTPTAAAALLGPAGEVLPALLP